MKALLPVVFLSLLVTGCATGRRESGNLARFLVQNLQEWGAEFPRVNLQQPAIGIDQLYTSWRWKSDPGGFSLEFHEGVLDGVEHQVRAIAGPAVISADTGIRIWRIDKIAHIDLVHLSPGKIQLTCRRLAGNSAHVTVE